MAYSTQESFFAYDSFNSATSCLINQCLSSSPPGMLKTYDSLLNMDAIAWNINSFMVSKYLAGLARCPKEQQDNEIMVEDTNSSHGASVPIDAMLDDCQQLKVMLDEKNYEIAQLTQVYCKVKGEYDELFADARDRIKAYSPRPILKFVERKSVDIQTEIEYTQLKESNELLLDQTISPQPIMNLVVRKSVDIQTEIKFTDLKQNNELLYQKTEELNDLMKQFAEAQENVKDFDLILAERDMLRNKLEYASKSQANESNRMSDQVRNLQSEISEMQRKENDLRNQHENLLDQNKNLMKDQLQIEKAERETTQYKNCIKDNLQEIEKVGREATQYKNCIADNLQQIEKLQNEIQQKNDLLLAAQNHINEIEKELNALEEKCESHSVDNEIFAEQQQENDNLLKGMQQAIQFALMLLLEGTRITTHLRSEIYCLKDKLNTQELCDRSTSGTELFSNLDESEIEELRLKVKSLEEKIFRRDKEVELLRQQNGDVVRVNDSDTEDGSDVNNTIGIYKSAYSDHGIELCNSSTNTTMLSSNVDESEIEEMHLKIKSLEEEILRKNREVELLQQQEKKGDYSKFNNSDTKDDGELNNTFYSHKSSDIDHGQDNIYDSHSGSNSIQSDQKYKYILIEVDEISETQEKKSCISLGTESDNDHGPNTKGDDQQSGEIVDESELNTERRRLTNELRAVIENLVNKIDAKQSADFQKQKTSNELNIEAYQSLGIDKKLVTDQIISVIERLIKNTESNIFDSLDRSKREPDGDDTSVFGYSTDDENIATADFTGFSSNLAAHEAEHTIDVSLQNENKLIASSDRGLNDIEFNADNISFNGSSCYDHIIASADPLSYLDQSTFFGGHKLPSTNLNLKVDNETQMAPKLQSIGTQYSAENIHSFVENKNQDTITSNIKLLEDDNGMKDESQMLSSEFKAVIDNLVMNMESVSLSAVNDHHNIKSKETKKNLQTDDKTVLATHLRAVIEEVINSEKEKLKENVGYKQEVKVTQQKKIDELTKENNELQSMIQRLQDQVTKQNDAERTRSSNCSLIMTVR